ncbi:hypothetical protein ACWDTI_16840 [Gordonia sp. NPDC003424]
MFLSAANSISRTVAIVAATVAVGASAVGAAAAAPVLPPDDLPVADAPVAPGDGEYSYLATHAVTKQAAAMKIPDAIASLPVPAQFRPANLALAAQFDVALTSALRSPGGCLQVIVDPRSRDGNLFNYGFFPVAARYCP